MRTWMRLNWRHYQMCRWLGDDMITAARHTVRNRHTMRGARRMAKLLAAAMPK